MAKWKYRLDDEGKKLRELIHESDDSIESYQGILNQVKRCAESLLKQLDNKDDDKEYYERELGDLIEQVEIHYDLDDEDDPQETVDWVLGELYDICDACKCWIELN